MKAILFCVQPYAFGILEPLQDELQRQGHEVVWYTSPRLVSQFPFADGTPPTADLAELQAFRADAIFVPGNEVPHYLRGVKVQVFHGLAGEKKGHFRVRHYFDLYLTQGPYFTRRFEAMARRYRNFEVRETGWCKLDPLHAESSRHRAARDALLASRGGEAVVLYAPTFSPSLTSAGEGMEHVMALADRKDIQLLIKFHDLMDRTVVAAYREQAAGRRNVEIVEDRNILRVLGMADVLVSDTSSAVYEFLLLDRPVITINSRAPEILWRDLESADQLGAALSDELRQDHFRAQRQAVVAQYHPYSDGRSSARMLEAVEDYIRRHGVPDRRQLSPYRRYVIKRKFG